MSKDWCVNYNWFNDRFVDQSCSDKTRFLNEDDETRQRQRLNDHLFLNVLDVSSSLELDVNLRLAVRKRVLAAILGSSRVEWGKFSAEWDKFSAEYYSILSHSILE